MITPYNYDLHELQIAHDILFDEAELRGKIIETQAARIKELEEALLILAAECEAEIKAGTCSAKIFAMDKARAVLAEKGE